MNRPCDFCMKPKTSPCAYKSSITNQLVKVYLCEECMEREKKFISKIVIKGEQECTQKIT